MNGFMNPAEFANIRRSEEDFWWYRGMREILFRMLEPHLAGRGIGHALEAGCGTGYLSQRLQRERRWPIVPLDYSGDGLRYGRELGVGNAVQGDIRSLPFGDGAFDLVLSLDVLAHLPRGEEHAAARELSRVARRGGLVVVRTSALDILRSRHGEFACERQRFTRRRLMETIRGRGHTAVALHLSQLPAAAGRAGQIPDVGAAVAPAPESGVQPVAAWLDRLLFAPLAMEAAWLGAGRNFPAGQSLLLIGEKMS